MIASVAGVATTANRQILSNWVKLAMSGSYHFTVMVPFMDG